MSDSDTSIQETETKPVVENQQELPKFEKDHSDKITAKFGSKTEIAFVKPDRIRVNVKKEDILDVASFLRDELNYDHAESVTGVDFPADKEIEVVYHLGSYTDPQLNRQVLSLASLREIFYSVEFHERECFEMLGVFFEGHPDNRRLLLPEDWADLPPLRKDFAIKGR
jgi:NADH-quinone oxidoreductase subunit C